MLLAMINVTICSISFALSCCLASCGHKDLAQTDKPQVPAEVLRIFQKAESAWNSNYKNIYIEKRLLEPEILDIIYRDGIIKNIALRPVVLGETEYPHMYQIISATHNDLSFYIKIEVAFTVKERDVRYAISDYTELKKNNKEWEMGTRFKYNLKPFYIVDENRPVLTTYEFDKSMETFFNRMSGSIFAVKITCLSKDDFPLFFHPLGEDSTLHEYIFYTRN
jgi:hypothetical protein